MKDEIKEILDNPKILMLSYGNYISLDDYVKLKDYITNLQEENERLNNIIDAISNILENYGRLEYYYKYNSKYLKSEIINDLKEVIELKEGK